MAPTGSMEVFAHKFIRKMTLKAGLPGTSIEARVQATASSAWTISKNSTAIGTITWAAGATVPTIAFTADVLFDVGDWLVITSAAMPDTTLNRIAGTIVMERRA
jgi:hypothetical protein